MPIIIEIKPVFHWTKYSVQNGAAIVYALQNALTLRGKVKMSLIEYSNNKIA